MTYEPKIPIKSLVRRAVLGMSAPGELDRLSALLRRFEIAARRVDPERGDGANLMLIRGEDGATRRLIYRPLGAIAPADLAEAGVPAATRPCAAACARLGDANPIATALPRLWIADPAAAPELEAVAALLRQEAERPRCGGAAAFSRLAEVLIILILRQALETGATRPGLLAGLADPNLSRSLTAMHEAPQRRWRVEDLAEEAGLSRSHFMARFRAALGRTPMGYLRDWRLTLARRELERGARLSAVARRYGYGGGDTLTRAFQRSFGAPPPRGPISGPAE